MARNSTFLLRFQEPCLPGDDASLGTSTETRAREERDQDHQGWAATAGETFVGEHPYRSGSDSDPYILTNRGQVSMRGSSLGTRTVTEAREERDQDRSNLTMGTATKTGAREEQDADVGQSGYNVLPLGL